MKLIDKSEFENLEKNIKIEKVVAGGSVANTMAGISYLKGRPSFIGKVNSDIFICRIRHYGKCFSKIVIIY